MTVMNLNGSMNFDFDAEARSAAVCEACQTGSPEWKECTLDSLCPDCECLAKQIKSRLERAFLAGQLSMQASGD